MTDTKNTQSMIITICQSKRACHKATGSKDAGCQRIFFSSSYTKTFGNCDRYAPSDSQTSKADKDRTEKDHKPVNHEENDQQERR